MATQQFKFGLSVMIEFQVFPGTGIVTFGATLPVTTVMHIIDTVAAEAGFRCLLVLVINMATVTFYFVLKSVLL